MCVGVRAPCAAAPRPPARTHARTRPVMLTAGKLHGCSSAPGSKPSPSRSRATAYTGSGGGGGVCERVCHNKARLVVVILDSPSTRDKRIPTNQVAPNKRTDGVGAGGRRDILPQSRLAGPSVAQRAGFAWRGGRGTRAGGAGRGGWCQGGQGYTGEERGPTPPHTHGTQGSGPLPPAPPKHLWWWSPCCPATASLLGGLRTRRGAGPRVVQLSSTARQRTRTHSVLGRSTSSAATRQRPKPHPPPLTRGADGLRRQHRAAQLDLYPRDPRRGSALGCCHGFFSFLLFPLCVCWPAPGGGTVLLCACGGGRRAPLQPLSLGGRLLCGLRHHPPPELFLCQRPERGRSSLEAPMLMTTRTRREGV